MKLCFEHVVVQILLTLLHACGILVLINLTDIPDCFKYILFVMWTLITVSKQSCSQVYLSSCHTLGLLTSLVWTNLFNTSSRYTTSSWYYPMIGQLWQLTSTLTSLRAQTNKHAEYVKPSDTAPFDGLTFDILTRETVFYQEVSGIVDGLWYLKWCLQAAPFSHPAVSRSFAILSLLARFFHSPALTESLAQAIFRKEIFSTGSLFCPF